MIDLILFVFVVCVFVFGWWCGKTFGPINAFIARLWTRLRDTE